MTLFNDYNWVNVSMFTLVYFFKSWIPGKVTTLKIWVEKYRSVNVELKFILFTRKEFFSPFFNSYYSLKIQNQTLIHIKFSLTHI